MAAVNHRCAVLGKPIAHSLSPVLHNAAYAALGLDDWRYSREEVAQDDLPDFLGGLDSSWAGLSLTMPLKRGIQPYGMPCDDWSKMLGVSNTAIIDWNSASSKPAFRLYNTDVEGIVQAFNHAWSARDVFGAAPNNDASWPEDLQNDNDISIGAVDAAYDGARAVILGNGNTGLSALAALTRMTVPHKGRVRSVVICARHCQRNEAFERLLGQLGHDVTLSFAPLDGAAMQILHADIVVSTLPAYVADDVAGAVAAAGECPYGLEASTLLDVVYAPHPSALLRAWTSSGRLGIGGEEMLLYQAIAQVRLMTERYVHGEGADLADTDGDSSLEQTMRQALREKI